MSELHDALEKMKIDVAKWAQRWAGFDDEIEHVYALISDLDERIVAIEGVLGLHSHANEDTEPNP